ncbi:tellurite resistance TerB family protein [Brevundimonas sp. TWP1-2-1b1]|uniref:tellurite resistance TerB family protein n=1 Tax=unclassified Brevundimonas TaxID=2622653 RepID=UPI003CE6F612
MPRSLKHHRRRTIHPDDVWTPGDMVQMDAVVAACALVAQADGWVTPRERNRMVERMRQASAVSFFGAHEVIDAFETLNLRFERDLDDGEATARTAVSRLRGHAGPSRLLVETACSVAAADGGFDSEERAVILDLCRWLGLNAAEFDLVPEPARPPR